MATRGVFQDHQRVVRVHAPGAGPQSGDGATELVRADRTEQPAQEPRLARHVRLSLRADCLTPRATNGLSQMLYTEAMLTHLTHTLPLLWRNAEEKQEIVKCFILKQCWESVKASVA